MVSGAGGEAGRIGGEEGSVGGEEGGTREGARLVPSRRYTLLASVIGKVEGCCRCDADTTKAEVAKGVEGQAIEVTTMRWLSGASSSIIHDPDEEPFFCICRRRPSSKCR